MCASAPAASTEESSSFTDVEHDVIYDSGGLLRRIVPSSPWHKNATAKRAASKTRASEISPTSESAEKAGDWVVLAWAVAQ